MQLHAVFVATSDFERWSSEDGLRRLAESDADLRVELPSADRLAETLETVRIQLEADAAGSRFPLFWRMALALADHRVYGWAVAELESLSEELRTIEEELERLPVELAATVMLGDEGFPEIYFRVSPELARAGIYQPPNLGTMMSPVLEAVREVAVRAIVRHCSVALVREGILVEHLWRVR